MSVMEAQYKGHNDAASARAAYEKAKVDEIEREKNERATAAQAEADAIMKVRLSLCGRSFVSVSGALAGVTSRVLCILERANLLYPSMLERLPYLYGPLDDDDAAHLFVGEKRRDLSKEGAKGGRGAADSRGARE